MSREFEIAILQRDASNYQGPMRQLNLILSSPRVISPFAPLTANEEKLSWLARNGGYDGEDVVFHFWGTWRLGWNSVTNAVDQSKTIATTSTWHHIGWRMSSRTNELQFVELWNQNGKLGIEVMLKLYNADRGPQGIFPYGVRQRMSTGFPEKGNGIFEVRSLEWRAN